MKFGVLQFFSWSGRIPLETVYERAFDRIAIMDEGGYDAVWLAEHHFTTYSVCPSVCMMGTHIAARTKNLRIGTAITLAGFYHPLRLAEELALLDIFSGGRLNWGAGRGFDQNEFRTFKVDPAESSDRFRECVDIVLEAWSNDTFSYQGKFWEFENVRLLPKPVQKPLPPHWIAATSDEAVIRSAKEGHTILMDPHSSNADIARKRRLFEKTLTEAGHSMEGREFPTARLIALGDTEEEAEAVAREGAKWTVGSYMKVPGQVDPVERYMNDVIIYGTPEKVVDRLRELESEVPLNYFMASPLSHKSFLLFTEKVMPKFV